MIYSPRQPGNVSQAKGTQPLSRLHPVMIQDVNPMRRTARRVASVQPVAPRQPAPLTLSESLTTKSSKQPVRKKILRWIRAHALIIMAPAVIFVSIRLSVMPLAGEIIIGLYGLASLILRKPSRLSFWLATMVLLSIGIEIILLPGRDRANNSALFVFCLLCVGLISMVLETRHVAVQNRQSRRR